MTPRIRKLASDIEKTRARVTEMQEKLDEMERLLAELENTEIVSLFRSLDLPTGDLPALIASLRDNVLPLDAEPAPVDDFEEEGDHEGNYYDTAYSD